MSRIECNYVIYNFNWYPSRLPIRQRYLSWKYDLYILWNESLTHIWQFSLLCCRHIHCHSVAISYDCGLCYMRNGYYIYMRSPITQRPVSLGINSWPKTYAFAWKVIFWSAYKFAHAMTAELSWHVQICDLIGSLESKSRDKEFSRDLSSELMNH